MVVLGCVALIVGVAACGSSSSGSGATAASGGGSGNLKGNGGEIVYFVIATQGVPYFIPEKEAMEEEAAKLDYKMKFVVNNVDPTQLQEQIQQAVASGEKPAAYMLLSLDPKAAVNEARELSQVAPTFEINQSVEPEAYEYLKAYIGPNDVLIGKTAGESLLKKREELKAEGYKFKSPNGGLLVISELAGTATSADRYQGITEANEKGSPPLEILHNEPCCSDTQGVYEIASQLIPKYESKMDFMYVQNNSSVAGAAKALKQNGLTPGKDVWIVSGNCGGPLSVMKNEEVESTGEQLAYVEGVAAVETVARYLATGEVEKGESIIKYSKQPPTPTVSPPKQMNILENPPISGGAVANQVVYGRTVAESCPLE